MHQWNRLQMDSVMMTPTMKDAAMMVATVVELASTLNNVQNVCVMKKAGNQQVTFHVSEFFRMLHGPKNHNNHTLTVNTGCESGFAHYIGDGYCDDENNNVGCQFDGGDCCDNDYYNWNDYCDDCHCLEE